MTLASTPASVIENYRLNPPDADTCDGLCESNPCICADVGEMLDECHRMGDGDAITSLAWLDQIDRTSYADGAWECVHGWLYHQLSVHEKSTWARMQEIQRAVDTPQIPENVA